jgi:glycosyltransferase involved in cell wall biosynthesis
VAFPRDGGRLFYRLLAERNFRQSDWVIANSAQIATDLIENFGVSSDRVIRVNNPLDVAGVRRLANEPVTELDLDDGVPTVVFVGRLERIKGLEHLLTAVASVLEVSPVRCLLIGEGSQHGYLRALSKHLGTDEYVHFLGTQPNPFRFMSKATVFVLPSLSEGMSNVLLEALACGCPIVATDIAGGGTREVLVDGECGVIVPCEDPKALAGAIAGLLADAGVRERLALAARERADDFDTSKIIGESERALLMVMHAPVLGERIVPEPAEPVVAVEPRAEKLGVLPPLPVTARVRRSRRSLISQVLREQGVRALSRHAMRSLRRRLGLRDPQVIEAAASVDSQAVEPIALFDHPWFAEGIPLCVAAPDSLDSLRVTLEAIRRARRAERVRCIVAGTYGGDSHATGLATELEIDDEVYFASECDDVRACLHDGAILIHAPAMAERALPESLVEAAAAGCPIVAARSSSFAIDFLGDSDRGLLVPMGDACAIAEAILETVWDESASTDRVARARASHFHPR